MGAEYSSIYFKSSEVRCKCGCGRMPTPHMMAALDRIRTAWGHPLVVTSGARCEAYTRKLREDGIPAALKSAHIEGLAVDIAPSNKESMAKFKEWLLPRLEGLGIWLEDYAYTGGPSSGWAHVQIRPAKNRVFIP